MDQDKTKTMNTQHESELEAQAVEPDEVVKAPMTQEEVRALAMEKLKVGKIELEVPILAAGEPVKEIHYDFGKIESRDYIEAMDSAKDVRNTLQYSNGQAFALFLKAAARCNKGLDEHDLRERMKWPDALAAIRLALVFFAIASQRADARTKSD